MSKSDTYYDGDYYNCREITMDYANIAPLILPNACVEKSHISIYGIMLIIFIEKEPSVLKFYSIVKKRDCNICNVLEKHNQNNADVCVKKYVKLSKHDFAYKDDVERNR